MKIAQIAAMMTPVPAANTNAIAQKNKCGWLEQRIIENRILYRLPSKPIAAIEIAKGQVTVDKIHHTVAAIAHSQSQTTANQF